MSSSTNVAWGLLGVAVVAVGAALAWRYIKANGGVASVLGGAAEDVANAAVSVPLSVAGGAVLGTGDALGIPRTDKTQCELDKEAGHWWDASFSCPAGDYIKSGWGALWTGKS